MSDARNNYGIAPDELAPGETVIWFERADPTANMRSHLGTALFSIPLLASAGFGLEAAIGDGKVMGMIVAAIFAVVGAGLLLSPPLALFLTLQTSYAITNRRLIISKRNGRSTTSIDLRRIGQVQRIRNRGTTTLWIPASLVSDGEVGQRVDYIKMLDLKDGERAYRLLIQWRSPSD